MKKKINFIKPSYNPELRLFDEDEGLENGLGLLLVLNLVFTAPLCANTESLKTG